MPSMPYLGIMASCTDKLLGIADVPQSSVLVRADELHHLIDNVGLRIV